jgi:hypothetical protein
LWIGAFESEKTENTFIWMETGEEHDFYNWGTGEPNDGGADDCMLLSCRGEYTAIPIGG